MAEEVVQKNILTENVEQPLNPAEGIPDFDPSKMPSLEELLQMVDGMKGMSEEERDQLKAQLLAPDPGLRGTSYTDYTVFFIMISIILSVFAYFGYKLYRSLTEKERKREEKLKAKQSKKKK